MQAAVLVLVALAAATDLARHRVPNWLTLPALLLGIAYRGSQGGSAAAIDALEGAALGLGLFVWMFWLGAMGGGDVKLLAAIGAWVGPRAVVDVGAGSVVAGAILGIAILAVRRGLGDFLRRMQHFVTTLVVKELEIESPKLNRKHRMPFAVPIAAAAAWRVLVGRGWL